MSPPSSNDPRSPNGPPDWSRHARTAMELDAVGPDEPQTRPASTFGLPPMTTQPFPAFTNAHAPAPQSEGTTQRWHAEDPRASTQPQTPSDRREVAAPPHAAAPVAVARMQEIGHKTDQTPVPPPSAAQRDVFTRTVIAAGHRIPSPMPEARAPVPAYPSQPYEDLRSAARAPGTGEPEAPQSLPGSSAAVGRAELPRVYDQLGQTTCSDVQGLLGKHPVPLPEFGASAGSAPVAWSRPLTDSGKPTPEAAPAVHAERAVSEPRREARERRQMEDDEVELHRVLSGASAKRRIALSLAVVVVSGLLGFSVYVRRSRSAETQLPLAAAPEAAASAPDTVVNTDGVGAPSQAAQDEEPVVASKRKQPEQPQGAPVAEASEPAAHATPGGVTASSAAALYINGQYKEALAEYQLLARAFPKQRVYAELARILRRKLIETCMRTQPNRREQCKTM